MNYKKIHDSLIENAKSNERKKNGGIYYEEHHIVPKCMGGKNEETNLVLLTGREHFIVHRLLAKLFPDSTVTYAPWKMACTDKNDKYLVTSRTYEYLRKEHAKRLGSPEQRLKKSIAGKGRKQTEEHKQARAKARKENGRSWFSEETKKKMSEAWQKRRENGTANPLKGKVQMVVECPHCRKTGGISSMHQWHFNNCKLNPNRGALL